MNEWRRDSYLTRTNEWSRRDSYLTRTNEWLMVEMTLCPRSCGCLAKQTFPSVWATCKSEDFFNVYLCGRVRHDKITCLNSLIPILALCIEHVRSKSELRKVFFGIIDGDFITTYWPGKSVCSLFCFLKCTDIFCKASSLVSLGGPPSSLVSLGVDIKKITKCWPSLA